MKSKKLFQLPAGLSSIDPDVAVIIRLEDLQDVADNQIVTIQAKLVTMRGNCSPGEVGGFCTNRIALLQMLRRQHRLCSGEKI